MQRTTRKYYGYILEYLFEPGSWMSDAELAKLRQELAHVNRVSKRNLAYGVFDPAATDGQIRDFFSRSALCVMRLDGEPVGFFYNVLLRKGPKPAIHAGLVLIARNTGVDLLAIPYCHLIVLQHRKYGAYHYTNISSTPSIIGAFMDVASDVWPNERGNARKPPSKEYASVLGLLQQEYIDRYFPQDQVKIDTRRFVMSSPSSQMGFESDPRKLPRHHRMETNLLCNYWLDYSRGEDMIQVGEVRLSTVLKHRATLALVAVKQLFARPEKAPAPAKRPAIAAAAAPAKPVFWNVETPEPARAEAPAELGLPAAAPQPAPLAPGQPTAH